MRERHLQDLVVSARTGIQVGTVVYPVLGIDIGTGVDQRLGRLDTVVMRSHQQWRGAVLVPGIDAGPFGKQGADRGCVAVPGRHVQRSLLILCTGRRCCQREHDGS
ncbi:hypothetical protein AYR66_08780 [Noviherbaspirillum denitrificans]|uniref:Uncharacterized protein n=1 Tax=Noviherbaspirillum denitrificans TaxID=1968433 RepID=A0A254TGD4_9BURK|nr:hypothetical protein AYR66_08780 [Noviherbaspirillum denitrificans]